VRLIKRAESRLDCFYCCDFGMGCVYEDLNYLFMFICDVMEVNQELAIS